MPVHRASLLCSLVPCLVFPLACTDADNGSAAATGPGSGGDGASTSSSAGGSGGDGGTAGSGGSGAGGGEPAGAPLFVAQGHFARTTISCDGGESWIANQSTDDAARCWSDNGQPDCDHAPGSARGMTFGEGWFVATFGWGPPGAISRSRDGVSWEAVTDDTTFAGVAYGDGVFVAGNFAPSRSTDGAETWAELPWAVNQNVRRTAFVDVAGGLFVMATDGPLLFSDDRGDSWWEPTSVPSGCGHNIMFSGGIAFGNDTILVLGGDGLACRSTNGGQTFEATDLGVEVTSDLLFDGTHFLAWSSGNLHQSTDGETWSTTALSENLRLGAVARGDDGTLVAVNGGWQVWYEQQTFYRSADGIDWELLGAASYTGSHPIFDIAFGRVDRPPACER